MGCVRPIVQPIYNGTDNVIRLALEGDDGALLASLAAITRVTLLIGATLIDSDVVGSSVIWWTDTATLEAQSVGVVSLKLGGEALAAGTYDDCVLTTYDATNVNGLRYAPTLSLTVYAA